MNHIRRDSRKTRPGSWRDARSNRTGSSSPSTLDESHPLLDVGCGPGTITVGMAQRVTSVHAIDFGASQIELARNRADHECIHNIEFTTASCYQLPYGDESFDRVFSHALMEHLARPLKALAEIRRVLKPGGILGVCSPDFGARLLVPHSPELDDAAEACTALQSSNRGDLQVGRKLGSYLNEAGFDDVMFKARLECYPSPEKISEYLALSWIKRQCHSTHRVFVSRVNLHRGCLHTPGSRRLARSRRNCQTGTRPSTLKRYRTVPALAFRIRA